MLKFSFYTVFVVLLLMSHVVCAGQPPFSNLPYMKIYPIVVKPERLVIYAADGKAEFRGELSGRPFIARGSNYIWLKSNSTGVFYHSTFDPESYDPIKATQDLLLMNKLGFNYVRVFIVSDWMLNGFGGMNSPGVDSRWLFNIVDFISRAARYQIRVVLTGDWLPSNYSSIANSYPIPELVNGTNQRILAPGSAVAYAHLWHDILSGMRNISPNSLAWILSIDIINEAYVDLSAEPFSLTSGSVTLNGVSYDMSDPSERQQAIDDSAAQWLNTICASIKAIDPHLFVSTSVFPPDDVGHLNFDGAKIPAPGMDTRYPLRPLSLMTSSNADYIDIHVYPTGSGYSEQEDLYSAQITPGTNLNKPLFMGEYGASTSDYHNISEAAVAVKNHILNSCVFGFSGWGFWTWYTTQQPGFYTLNGPIRNAISPYFLPNVCPISTK